MNEILTPIKEELKIFEKHFDAILDSNVKLIKDIAKYINSGKRLRPALMLLVAKYFAAIGKKIDEQIYNNALVIELLHSATLLHDDVVDEAKERRNKSSVNNNWNNKIAVLMGDFFFALVIDAALKNKDLKIFEAIRDTAKIMAEGELLAMQMSNDLDYDEELYYKLIYSKTASLIEISCKITASACTNDLNLINKFTEFGKNIGMAFQLKDDIFDYSKDAKTIGKPVGNDIREKKLTLPLIFALSNANQEDSNKIRNIIKKDELKDTEIDEIIEFARVNKGIEYAYQKAKEFIEKAIVNIDFIENNEIKNNLMQFAFYMIEREK